MRETERQRDRERQRERKRKRERQRESEREIIRKWLGDASKVITFKDELWGILIDCEVSTLPNDRNFKELMIEAAKKQFIQKPFYI